MEILSQHRINFLDIAKGLGIIFVVEGHCINGNSFLGRYIWLFHMPLFFLIAGCLFDSNKYVSFMSFAIRRFRQILLPCIYFLLIIVFLSFFLGIGYEYKELLYSLPGSLWFLPVIFFTELFYFLYTLLLKGTIYKISLIVLCVIIGVYLHNNRMGEIHSASSVFPALAFYGIGNLCKQKIVSIHSLRLFPLIVISFLFLIPFPMILFFHDTISIAGNHIGQPVVLFYVASVLTCMGFFAISNLLDKYIRRKEIVIYLGRNTLIILSLHMFFIGICTHFILPFFSIKMIYKIVEFLFVWIFNIGSIWLINTYLPWIVPQKYLINNEGLIDYSYFSI